MDEPQPHGNYLDRSQLMVQQQAALLKPESLVAEFKKNGVTHIVTIPDSETNYLYELMKELI